MRERLSPNPKNRKMIEGGADADSRMCWTCGSCDFECPVNAATGLLRPQKIVRMASLGMLEELIHLPELWYCLQCRRCTQICPNAVKPEPLIQWLRERALERGLFDRHAYLRYRDLFAAFQRVRWHAAALCREGELQDVTDRQWHHWMQDPVPLPDPESAPIQLPGNGGQAKNVTGTNRLTLCFTCGECSSACPVAASRSVFDPRSVVRMAALGMEDVLFHSPSIWLCLSCGRCTNACTQTVRCREVIEDLQERAMAKGAVDRGYVHRLRRADRLLYSRLLDEIDVCLRPKSGGIEHTLQPRYGRDLCRAPSSCKESSTVRDSA